MVGILERQARVDGVRTADLRLALTTVTTGFLLLAGADLHERSRGFSYLKFDRMGGCRYGT
jgi:hypothetical protein